MMVFYKFILVYILGGPGVGAEIGAGLRAEIWAGKNVDILLLLVGAPPVSSSLPTKMGLRQVCNLVIW